MSHFWRLDQLFGGDLLEEALFVARRLPSSYLYYLWISGIAGPGTPAPFDGD